jgi:signal peptidase I
MTEFQFPDEIKTEKKEAPEELQIEVEGETEIEVVDDTPEQDRNRAPMKEAPTEVTDDELSQYSEGVKKRIQHFSKGYHEERRAKEAALREREEAVRLAHNLVEENKRLQGSLGQGQQALLEQAKKVVQNELDQAKQKFKAAYEAGDSDALVEAQEALASAKYKAERVNNFKPAVAQPQNTVVQPAPRPEQTVKVDPKAKAWQEANSWFGDDKEMTALALAVHQDLVESGVDTTSDEYYDKLNNRVRKRFPEAFTSEKPKKSSVVAPATRSTAPRKIVLTQSQVQIAKRLGLTNEQYARAVAEEMRKQNG